MYSVPMRQAQNSTKPGVAPTIRARITNAGDHYWRPEDFADLQNPNAVDQALADLHSAGELRRIRRGLYWRGHRTAFGMSLPSGADIIKQITGLPYGIGPASYSAALALGLSTQVPRKETFALPIRTPTGLPEGIVAVSRSARRGRLDAKLRPQEVAWLEIAESRRDHLADFAQAEDRFIEFIDSGLVRPDRIAAAARTEPPAVKQTVVSLLRAAGREDETSKITLRLVV